MALTQPACRLGGVGKKTTIGSGKDKKALSTLFKVDDKLANSVPRFGKPKYAAKVGR